jgi:hypothetical protein
VDRCFLLVSINQRIGEGIDVLSLFRALLGWVRTDSAEKDLSEVLPISLQLPGQLSLWITLRIKVILF